MQNKGKPDTAFKRIVIMGYGKVTGEVLTYVQEKKKDYGYQLEFIEHEIHSFSITEKICREHGIPFAQITDKGELAEYLDTLQEKTLIISASNNFLFPKTLVEKENITIINFHNALLPDYPGRNAPSWVIYMGEKETGITWHYVTAGVDEGNIIIQKHCPIGEDTKAYELTETLMNLAYEGFMEIFADILAESVLGKPQQFATERRMYRSKEVPGNGRFSMTDEPQDIYRLLRSVDYGKNDIFPKLYTVYDGEKIEILRYRKIDKSKISEGDAFLYLPLDENNVIKMKYQKSFSQEK